MLIKPLVFCIKRRDANVYYSHFSDGPVAAAWLDKDGGERLDRNFFAVELHLAGAFEDEVDFGQFFVVMHPRVLLNIDDVHGGGGIVRHGERPLGKTAGTFNRVNIIKMCYHIVCHTFVHKLYTIELLVKSLYILPDVCDLIKACVNLF